jgi:hypothetical protein
MPGHATRRRPRVCVAIYLAAVLLAAGSGAQAAAARDDDALSGPDIVIIAEPDRTIYEFRQGGQLRMVRIEPTHGKPYYLVPRDNTKGFGDLERADMLLPSWVIFEF